jgi:VCBS repeat-containing protein
VWNRNLTPTEIAANRFLSVSGTSTGLVAAYQLNEGTGTIAANGAVASSAIDGTLTNGATWSSQGHPTSTGSSSSGVNAASIALTAADPDGPVPTFITTGWSAVGTNLFSRAGIYGTATLNTATGLVSYSLDNSLAATQGLGVGVVVSDPFLITVTDGVAQASQSVSFSITGTNDTPLITATDTTAGDVAALTETHTTLSISGSLTVTDPDLTDTVTVAVSSLALSGSFLTSGSTLPAALSASSYEALKAMLALTPAAGTTLAADPSAGTPFDWTFNSGSSGDSAFNFLSEGETLTLTYTLTLTDSSGAPSPQASPAATTTVAITITGTNNVATLTSATKALTETNAVLSTSGQLVLADLDATAATVVAQSNQAGTYGKFSIDAAGQWSYATNDALNSLNAGQVVRDSFNVSTTDGGTASVTVTITGSEDIATLTSAAKALTETNAVLSTSGQLVLADLDATAATVVAQSNQAGTYGKFSIDAAGQWSYATNDALNSLNVGQVVSDIFNVSTTDGGSASVTVTITGSEDIATLTSATKALTETNSTLSTSGQLVLADPDATAATVVAQSNQAGTYGKFSIDAAGKWSYVTNDALDSLSASQVVNDIFTVATADGGSASITVAITGTNDSPQVVAQPVLSENFDALDGIKNGGQYLTNEPVQYSASLPGWTASGVHALHVVGRGGPGTGNDALMIYGDNAIVSHPVNNANVAGQAYAVTFEMAPAVYQGASQATTASDRLKVSIRNSANQVIASYLAAPGAFSGVPVYTPASFSYVGDGNGPITVKIDNQNPSSGRFAGAIDNLQISPVATVSLAETNTTLSTNGSLTVIDLDTSDTVSAAVSSVALSGSFMGSGASLPATLGSNSDGFAALKAMLTLSAAGDISALAADASAGSSFNWAFTSGATGDAAFDFLKRGRNAHSHLHHHPNRQQWCPKSPGFSGRHHHCRYHDYRHE